MRIEIPMLPPVALGPNASRKMHWGARLRIKHTWQNAAYYEMLPYRDKALKKATMSVTCVIPDKRHEMDTDNVLAILKPIIDMLKPEQHNSKHPERKEPRLAVIVDDNPDVLTINKPVWIVDKARAPLTIIQIEAQS